MQILERVSKGGVHKLLNLADVKEIEIPMPTLDVIEKYTEIKLHLKGLVTKCESAKKNSYLNHSAKKPFLANFNKMLLMANTTQFTPSHVCIMAQVERF